MRHGSVDYFPAGAPHADADRVELSAQGCAQADAAGDFFVRHDVRFDRAVATGLPRTQQTAQRVLARLPSSGRPSLETASGLQELRAGADEASLEGASLREAFLAPFEHMPGPQVRYRGGESLGELRQRVDTALDALLDDPSWDAMLVVAHGAVNRAILTRALGLPAGGPLLANFQQAPGCINAIDIAAAPAPWLVRFTGLAPYDAAQRDHRDSTMETLFGQYLASRSETA